MAPFRYYAGAGAAKYLLDVQSAYLDMLPTRAVVPLVAQGFPLPGFRDLTPTLAVGGDALLMMTPLIAAVPRRRLRAPLGDLLAQADAIERALRILLSGF